MRILLDDMPCDLDATHVGPAIVAASAMAESDGRIIVDVRVDGRSWSEQELSDLAGDETTADEVRLTTAEPRDLVDQTLRGAAETLDGIDELQRDAAERVESGDTAGAMASLESALDRWLEVQQAIALGAQLLQIDLDHVEVGGAPAHRFISDLNQRLRMIRSALQMQDPIGMSDTLLYELPEVVQSWRDLVEQLRQDIAAGEQA